jgi:polyphosphate glucokinase
MAVKKSVQTASGDSRKERPLTLAVDIGGSGIKAEKLDAGGRPVTQRARIPTPRGATPKKVLRIIRKLAAMQGDFDRVSVGFPGVVRDGIVYTAANMGNEWKGFALEQAIRRKLGKPARIANDADVQGLGSVTGRGVELVVTLGTGFGSVVFVDGRRLHLELGHHPFHKGKTYEDELGRRALKKKGKTKWNRLLREAIDDLKQTFNYDRLYIGGGNARDISFKLPKDVKVVSNLQGLLGGIRLWNELGTHAGSRDGPLRAVASARGVTPSGRAGGCASNVASPPSGKP